MSNNETVVAAGLSCSLSSTSSTPKFESLESEPTRTVSKKRISETDISKFDEEEEEEEDDDDDDNDESEREQKNLTPFPRANEQVLKSRKIVKARRPGLTEAPHRLTTVLSGTPLQKVAADEATKPFVGSNPFASICFTNKTAPSLSSSSSTTLPSVATAATTIHAVNTVGKEAHEQFEQYAPDVSVSATAAAAVATNAITTEATITQSTKPPILFGTSSGLSFSSATGFGGFASTPFTTWGDRSKDTVGFGFGTIKTDSIFKLASSQERATTATDKQDNENDDDDDDDDDDGEDDEEEGDSGNDNYDEEEKNDLQAGVTSDGAFQSTHQPVVNGEELEHCIYQGRAKLFTQTSSDDSKSESNSWSHTNDTASSASLGPTTLAVLGVPPTKQNDSSLATAIVEQKHSEAATDRRWREVGIGPLRLLETKDTTEQTTNTSRIRIRIVQRRETTPGGPGTKVILNVPISGLCRILRLGDKFVQFRALESSTRTSTSGEQLDSSETPAIIFKPVLYLFKVKTVNEADALQEAMEDAIQKIQGVQ